MNVFNMTMFELTYDEALRIIRQDRQVLIYSSLCNCFYKIVETEASLERIRENFNSSFDYIKYFAYFTL